jgi:outer membrane immunogenic protein
MFQWYMANLPPYWRLFATCEQNSDDATRSPAGNPKNHTHIWFDLINKTLRISTFKAIATAAFTAMAAISAASAADLAPRYTKAPVMVDPIYNWTGFYVGVNAGYSWGRSNTDASFFNANTNVLVGTGSSSFDMNGWVAGGQVGYNWQNQRFVWGLEGDIQATGQKGSTAFLCPGAICSPTQTAIAVALSTVNVTLDQKLEWFSTIRARAGYTITPTVMGYVTGGLAIGEVKSDVVITGRTGGVGAPFVSTFTSDRSTRVGWTVGAGAEASLGGNWTGKLEYLYVDLGRESFSAVNLANVTPVRGISARKSPTTSCAPASTTSSAARWSRSIDLSASAALDNQSPGIVRGFFVGDRSATDVSPKVKAANLILKAVCAGRRTAAICNAFHF